MIKIDQIKIDAKKDQNINEYICKKLKIKCENIEKIEILKKSIDARDKHNIYWVYNVGVILKNNIENKFKKLKYNNIKKYLKFDKKLQNNLKNNPVVVGFGPAGMFCALTLARMGFNPIVIEQGKCVEERKKDVQDFWNNRKLNKYSNVQFGEGGAGTFSDGKLNTNLNNNVCKIILNELVYFGADPDITINNKAHIGSDKLEIIVKNIRNEIISLGGQILFSHKFVDFVSKDNSLESITVLDLSTNQEKVIHTNNLFLALGHSARDTYKLLYNKNIKMKQKPFAMGVRIEHSQESLNKTQYGDYAKYLPNADYKLAIHLENNRSIFTFCMCPGGYVVASSSNEGEIVTNGMSNSARDNKNCNSAVLINVTPQDYNSEHPLAGMYFQEKYEKLAFMLGGKNYNAPCQTVSSFLSGDKTYNKDYGKTISSYKPNITFADLSKCMPDFVTESLMLGIPKLNEKLDGFAEKSNLLIGVETRSSSPITICRDENFQTNIKGIYPVGEGAGYAGGIISSAQDGVKTVLDFYNKINKKTE